MQQRLTRNEILENLVSRGALSEQDANDVRDAPDWSVGIKELVTYLAAIIIGVGVIRIVAVALKDASTTSIAVILYVVAVALGFASWKMIDRSNILDRFAEVCEMGALIALGAATGLVLSETDLKGEAIVATMGAVLLGWGVWRAPHTRFAGVLESIVAVPMFSVGLGVLIINDNPSVAGILLLVAGACLAALGWTDIGSAFLARAAGCLDVVIASLILAAHYQGAFRLLPIVVGATLFAIGSVQLAPEMLLAGAFSVIVGIVVAVTDWVSSEIGQGLVIVATGVVVLVVLGVQMKRAVSGQSPGAPSA